MLLVSSTCIQYIEPRSLATVVHVLLNEREEREQCLCVVSVGNEVTVVTDTDLYRPHITCSSCPHANLARCLTVAVGPLT